VQVTEGLASTEYWSQVHGWMNAKFLTSPLVLDLWAKVVLPAGVYSPPFRAEITREIEALGSRPTLTAWNMAPGRGAP
jgi:hypothetical protein